MPGHGSGAASRGGRRRMRATHGGRDDAHDEVETLVAAVGEKRRVDAHAKRLLVRLRRSEEDGDMPWVTELVCFFFNAQGDVLRIHRADQRGNRKASTAHPSSGTPAAAAVMGSTDGDDMDDAISLRRFESKEALEKERLTLLLDEVHPSVEVIGLLATYSTDEIARRPQLNAFDLACEAVTDVEDDDDLRSSTLISREGGPIRMYTYVHVKPHKVPANYVVLCKLYRDIDSRSDWIFHSIGASGTVRSSVNSVLAEAMQVFLLDIIPEIEIAHRNALNTVASICAALSRDEVLEIEAYFREEGVTRDEFAKLLLLALLSSRRELQRLSRAAALVDLLFEMFEQIDINGDGAVDWEEFTSFCVSLGLIATKQQQIGGSAFAGCSYHQQLVGPSNRTFPYQIRKIRSFSALRLIAVIQNKSAAVLMYDSEMAFLHEFNHVTRLSRDGDEALAILDVDYVATRNWLVVSSSDHLLTFWSVVNAMTGAYVYAFKIGSRCPIPHIQWCGLALNRLFTVSSEGVQLWDIEAKRVASRLTHHRDRITSCLEIQHEGERLLATSSFDTTIAVLRIPSMAVVFELCGHIQGVQQMDYHAVGGILLSSGFEQQAYCWSIHGQSLLTTLGGHQASLIGARFVSQQTSTSVAMVVTGDERGHFRLWDLSRCLKGHSTDLAAALQSFDIVTPNLCKFHTFACGMNSPVSSLSKKKKKSRSDESQDLVDIITGNFRLFRFHAVTHSDEASPPHHVTFNSISNTFVGSVDGVVTVWSANSGVKVEEPVTIRGADVCAIAFDMPRQRKLFVATSDGAIRLYNPITAVMLTKNGIHDGVVSSLIYCPRSSCLVSTGYDRRISISFSLAGKTDIDVLRTVENAHDSCITSAAYSQDFELVATGDDAGNIHVYDFQRLYLLFRCVGHKDEIRALHFHYSAPLLFSSDAGGTLYVWYIAVSGATYRITPVMQLTLACSNFFVTETRPSSMGGGRSSRPTTAVKLPTDFAASPVSSILCTPESKHASSAYVYAGTANGAIWGWDFRVLTNHARKNGVGKCFEYRFDDRRTGDGNYNALLRVSHKTSVLKLRPADPASEIDGVPAGPRVLQSCEATCVWQAHTAKVTQLLGLPYPGQLFSVSQDGSIKVWDPSHAAMGTITTMAKPQTGSENERAPGTGTTATSTWKFTHHHHMANDAREKHVEIAKEMLRRVKRRAQDGQRGWSNREHCGDGDDDTDAEVRFEQFHTPELTPVLAAAEKMLEKQAPFSKESRRAGVQTGLFGTEEAKLLRELAQGPHRHLQTQSRLAPLMAASPTAVSLKKRSHLHVPPGSEHELPVMRTMRHFPIEIGRRKASDKRSFLQPPDISLSPFLRDKLTETSPSRSFQHRNAAPKSAPKKISPQPLMSITMDASVVVVDNVVLPQLVHQQSQEIHSQPERHDEPRDECAESTYTHAARDGLASYASAPTLPIYQHGNLEKASAHSSYSTSHIISNVKEETPVASGPARMNIERKMRIYDGLGVSPSRAAPDEAGSDTVGTEAPPIRQRLAPQRQLSQPQLTRKASTSSLSAETSATRKRLSQSTPSPGAAVGSPVSNSFGPHYTTKQVIDFGGVIARFDNDCSGDIDKSEWVHMMQNCRPLFGSSDLEAAERLFHSIDRDDSGKISLKEILPMVFSKATPEQLLRMRQSIQARIDAAAGAMAANRAG